VDALNANKTRRPPTGNRRAATAVSATVVRSLRLKQQAEYPKRYLSYK